MREQKDAPQRAANTLGGKRPDQDTHQQMTANVTRILSCIDAACDTMVTLAIVLGDLARIRQTAATAKLAVDAWQLAVGVHDLAEDFTSWEAQEVAG
jgi:hypothetical protein